MKASRLPVEPDLSNSPPAEPLPGTSLLEAIAPSEPVRNFLWQQPEVERGMYVDRPGRLRGVVAILQYLLRTKVCRR
jgi:hypothetical protein